eukprot:SAG22_NODE_542_length_9294_cov_156.554649_7_plen_551_part_00
MTTAVVPRQLNFAEVLPVAIESRSNKRTFEPTNGNSFSPNGNKIIRLNINSDNLADFTHSYFQATLVNTSTRNLALDTGIPWINRVQILSGGQELESCDSYNRLHSMLQAVQGNPAQAGQFSLTQKENFPSAPVPVATGTIGGVDAFAADALTPLPSTTNFTDAGASAGNADAANAAAATALAINNAIGDVRTKTNTKLEALRVAIEAARATLNTADTAISGASDRFTHNGHTVATNRLATGESFTYNFSLISAILNQPKYFPLIFTNLGLDIYLHLEDGVNIGVYDNAIAGDDGGYRIDNVRFHCHLVDVDKSFYDRMRQSMMASGGVLQFSGTTYKHYLDTHPNNGPHNVQISTRVKSLNALFVRPQRAELNNNRSVFCLSQGESCGMTDYVFKIGSIQYPQNKISVTPTNLGECYNELRKCMGVLGNYAHDSWLNSRTFRLGPTVAADGNDMTGAVTMNGVADQSTAVQNSTKNFFVASYGFEGFAKTAAESGINVSDRALNVVCEINKDAIVYTANGAGKQIRYDVFAQTDMIIYLTADGQLSTRI